MVEGLEYSEQKRRLGSLLRVGEFKPIGYLDTEDLRLELDAKELEVFLNELRKSGKEIKIFPPNITEKWSGQEFRREYSKHREEYRKEHTHLRFIDDKTGDEIEIIVPPSEI